MISIHALLAESDVSSFQLLKPRIAFLSTLSLRRATLILDDIKQCAQIISIHALLAESDPAIKIVTIAVPNFYPRSPCGERRPRGVPGDLERNISIHALLAESDD